MEKFPKECKMPEKGWKSSLKFGTDIPESKQKERKPLKQVGKRTKERLATHGSEKDLFARVWASRTHACEDCGTPLTEPRAHNFDHVVPKGRDQSKRYDENNIRLVCFACHFYKTT